MAMNTSLQINKTEKINKATDLAEMGITYYKQKVDSIMVNAFSGKIITNQSELKTVMTQIKNDMNKIPTDQPKINVSGNEISYAIKDLAVDISNPASILVNFKTVGTSDTENREISYKINYTINQGKPLPVYNITDPGTFSSSSDECYKTNKIDYQKCFYSPRQTVPDVKIENSIIKVGGNGDLGHFNNVTSSQIYISGDILFSKVNNITNLRLHVEGDLLKGSELLDFTNFKGNTRLEIQGNASISKLNNIRENFELLIGKNLTLDELSSNTNGNIIVYGDASIKALSNNSNMNVCIFGKYNGPDPKPSYVRVYGETGFESDPVCGPYATARVPFVLESDPEENVSYK
ncbi:hypothetical protein [Bacillus sp. B-jedd]|uniref:hypothetical protein n=1 Tax=Bacillus sp. B-jedd TaxID=1476857 RepID=UPI0011DD05A5|nr:hypothetical protein [Bacillus sp. B-jedd]